MTDPYVLVCEVGVGNFTVARFATEADARRKAASKWCCWCLFMQDSSPERRGMLSVRLTGPDMWHCSSFMPSCEALPCAQELSYGGIGFAHPSIRKYATASIQSTVRDADARAAAAAAAEARFAQAAASRPKEKPRIVTVGGNEGKVNLADARAWD